MDIVLYPRAAPGDRIRVWIGAFQTTEAPALSWFLDGAPANPDALRPIESVRPDNLLPDNQPPETTARVFSGVYQFTGLQPDTSYTIFVRAGGGGDAELTTRTLPDELPAEMDRSFNVLLVSCHHSAEDRSGLSGIIVSQLKAIAKPQLSILAGDQVYLDLPTLADFPEDKQSLAEKFERDYTVNWRGTDGYVRVLAAAPSVSIPDDHEYWNNYPHPSPFIQNAWSQNGRDQWREAAQAMFRGFQLPYPNDLGQAFILDVRPLSFFIADTRSNKDPDRGFTMLPGQHKQLRRWVNRVIDERLFGVFVSGQSVFEDPISEVKGAVADYELPNYRDFDQLMETLGRLPEAGRPLICMTGDVHWGRIASAQDITTGRTAITEIISSPSSLVTTVGADTVKRIGGFFGGLFGKADPWPRHSEASEPPAFLASNAFGGRFQCSTIHRQRGNHVALLSFRQFGGGIECRVTYWPILTDSTIARPTELGPFQFTSA